MDATYEDNRVERRSLARDRDSNWTALQSDATLWLGQVRADLGFLSREYGDLLEASDAYREQHLKLVIRRDISPDTNFQALLRTDERTLLPSSETQRDLSLALSTRSYDLLRLQGLKLKTEARYVTRPSSFQRTQDETESLRLGARFSWDLLGGALEAGTRILRRQVLRLNRRGVDLLLQNPQTPLGTLQGLREELHPSSQRNWIKGTIPILSRARIFAQFQETSVDQPPRTAWGSDNASPLYYTNQRGSKFSLSLFPLEGVDLRAERKQEERFMAGRGDHFAGQDQRFESTYVNLHLGVIPRIDVNLQFSNFDTSHVDDQVQKETVSEVTDQAMDLAFALNSSVSLEGSYQRLTHDGTSGARQEIMGLALDYGGSAQQAHVRVDYTWDDFNDPEETASSYRARIVSLSGKLFF
jgi:hypothetical protein